MKKEKVKALFDVKNIKDLPENIFKYVKYKGIGKSALSIIQYFEIKKELTNEELLVAIYRNEGVERKPAWVTGCCVKLINLGYLERMGRTKYVLIKSVDE